MKINRRDFLLGATALPLLPFPFSFKQAKAAVGGGDNLYLVFNPLRNVEDGELNEYVTMAQLEKLLAEMKVPNGSTVIATGLRSGVAGQEYDLPGELALKWDLGSPWHGKVTHHLDSSPVPLSKEDPIVAGMFGVLNPATAHTFEVGDAKLQGSVLWTFSEDETVKEPFGIGFHNGFQDVDHGLTNALYLCSREAKAGEFREDYWRSRMSQYMPNLQDDTIWNNFTSSIGKSWVESQWIPYMKKQGWVGAAIILEGSMMNPALFHMLEVKNRTSPQQPAFQIGKGTHTALKIRFGREVRQFVEPGESSWTAVGFLWDTGTPEMQAWEQTSDVFGHDFHIHGARNDGTRLGHMLFSMLGSGNLKVSLYPLQYKNNENAFIFNNDLSLVPQSLSQTQSGLSIQVHNDGENFSRNVKVRLKGGFGKETVVIPTMAPKEKRVVIFNGQEGRNPSGKRIIEVDPDGDFLEGGKGRENNKLVVKSDLSWEWDF